MQIAVLVAVGSIAACAERPAALSTCAAIGARRSVNAAQCGPALDFTPINRYAGELFEVDERENAVALIDAVAPERSSPRASAPSS